MDQGIATSDWTSFLERGNLDFETLGGSNSTSHVPWNQRKLIYREKRMNSMFKKCKGNGES